jgi:DnaJ-class molecular chaperone
MKDYFEILNLKRNATEEDVSTAFKKLALKYHPMKNSQQMRMYLPKFHEICEAYEVLICQQHRTIYENYGWETLCSGIVGPDGGKYF